MKKRKIFNSKNKLSIIKQHLVKKEEISNLCKEFECSPRSIYQWEEVLFTKGHEVFENRGKPGRPVNEGNYKNKCIELEEKLDKKNEVISQIMEELLKAKKLTGVI